MRSRFLSPLPSRISESHCNFSVDRHANLPHCCPHVGKLSGDRRHQPSLYPHSSSTCLKSSSPSMPPPPSLAVCRTALAQNRQAARPGGRSDRLRLPRQAELGLLCLHYGPHAPEAGGPAARHCGRAQLAPRARTLRAPLRRPRCRNQQDADGKIRGQGVKASPYLAVFRGVFGVMSDHSSAVPEATCFLKRAM